MSILKLEDEIFEYKDSDSVVKHLFNNSNIGILSVIEQEELLMRKQEKKPVGRSFSKPNKESSQKKSIGDFEDNYANETSKKIVKTQANTNKKYYKIS